MFAILSHRPDHFDQVRKANHTERFARTIPGWALTDRKLLLLTDANMASMSEGGDYVTCEFVIRKI